LQSGLTRGARVVLRRCGNTYELCARSSAGSERLATNQSQNQTKSLFRLRLRVSGRRWPTPKPNKRKDWHWQAVRIAKIGAGKRKIEYRNWLKQEMLCGTIDFPQGYGNIRESSSPVRRLVVSAWMGGSYLISMGSSSMLITRWN